MKYLNDEQHYIDRYDVSTIEECLRWYWNIKDGFEKDRNKKQFKKYSKKKFDTEVHKVTSYTVNVISIQRYRHKAETIKEWMDRDGAMQECMIMPPRQMMFIAKFVLLQQNLPREMGDLWTH